jgi:hypothetical protein
LGGSVGGGVSVGGSSGGGLSVGGSVGLGGGSVSGSVGVGSSSNSSSNSSGGSSSQSGGSKSSGSIGGGSVGSGSIGGGSVGSGSVGSGSVGSGSVGSGAIGSGSLGGGAVGGGAVGGAATGGTSSGGALGAGSVGAGQNSRSRDAGTTASPGPAAAPAARGVSQPTSSRAAVNAPVVTGTTALPASIARRGGASELSLPVTLIPDSRGSDAGPRGSQFDGRRNLAGVEEPLIPRAGTPLHVVETCRNSIASAALPYGVLRVDAASSGRLSRTRDGGFAAPVEVKIVYAQSNARQVRQSRVTCHLDATGSVVALR